MNNILSFDNEEHESIVIQEGDVGERLDKILSLRYAGVHSRSYFQYLLEEERVFVNGEVVKKRYKPALHDEIQIHFLLTPEIGLTPEPIPLNIVYEDQDILVIDKLAGMVVHPAPGHYSGTFVHALLHHCQQLPEELLANANLRPGIVHRLDKETSGLLVAAKTNYAHKRLIEMFSQREVYKEYIAVCAGNPGNQEIRNNIGRDPISRQKMKVLVEGGRLAVSTCQTLAFEKNLSVVRVQLQTGRTHQIRVHMRHVNAPVLGDSIYGNEQTNKKYGVTRQFLHAHILRFKHPVNGKFLDLKADLPMDMKLFVKSNFSTIQQP